MVNERSSGVRGTGASVISILKLVPDIYGFFDTGFNSLIIFFTDDLIDTLMSIQNIFSILMSMRVGDGSTKRIHDEIVNFLDHWIATSAGEEPMKFNIIF